MEQIISRFISFHLIPLPADILTCRCIYKHFLNQIYIIESFQVTEPSEAGRLNDIIDKLQEENQQLKKRVAYVRQQLYLSISSLWIVSSCRSSKALLCFRPETRWKT